MKNKSLIITLTAIIALLCAYYLHFTFVARSFQSTATQYATDAKGVVNLQKKQAYLDSIWNEPVYTPFGVEFTYKDLKEKELALGLDLQGGMHVTLEVSPVEIIKALANNSTEPNFRKALEEAQKMQVNSQESFVDLFYDAFSETSSKGKLGRIFTNTANQGRINSNTPDNEVIEIIREEVQDAIDRSFNIIRTRIDKFGVANPNIQKLPGSGRISVELPGVDNPERVRKLLSGVAQLEFWEVWEPNELNTSFIQLSQYLAKQAQLNKGTDKGKDNTDKGSDLVAETDKQEETTLSADTNATTGNDLVAETETETDTTENDLVAETDTNKKQPEEELVAETDTVKKDKATKKDTAKTDSTENAAEAQSNAFGRLFKQAYRGFAVNIKDTAEVNALFAKTEVRSMFPLNVIFLWEVKPDENGNLNLYMVKKGRGGKAPLTGKVVTDARQDFEGGQPNVSMQMNAEGAKIWKRLTSKNIGRRIAIVLDGYVYSAPNVNGEIPNGSSSISGSFTVEEAKDLANVLKAGKLPAPTRIVEEATVGPSLGQESIAQGLTSILIGLAFVVVFMVLYYKSGGAIADVALLVNIFFIVGILVQFGAVLTLPGIAGIVLTIGMSVDANVLIYERIREELRNSKKLAIAIEDGYSKALSSIIDANATTFLTAVILYSFGSGGVKGFAVTLMIGIACSLFSAIFITRLLVETFLNRKENKGVSFDSIIFSKAFEKFNLDFIDLRKKAYMFSAGIILLGLISIIAQGGLTLGVDFKGGRSYVIEFESPVTVNEARKELNQNIESSVEVKTYGGNNKLKITTSHLINDESNRADSTVQGLVMRSMDKFKSKNPEIISSSKVGSTIADDIANTSYITVAFSLLVIFLYILVRFGKAQYGAGALVALIHDVFVVLAFMGFAQLLGMSYEVDQVFIAAMLTVVGYSINDTVVVFDRIREFAGDTSRQDFGEKLNAAINQTISRTIMTSSTTLLVVLILFLFGGEVLRGFSYSLLIGVLIGTYSSVFIASPIVLDISLLNLKKKPKVAGSK